MKSIQLWALVIGPWSFRRRQFPLLLPLLFLSACHRAPQNARELFDRLPRHWQGEVRLQGETAGRKIGLEVRQLTVRGEHVLEFNRVRYQLFAGGEAISEDEAAIRGTLTAPGGEVRLDVDGTDVGEAFKPGTFQGTLAGDLQSAEATWTTGLGQTATLKLHAAAP